MKKYLALLLSLCMVLSLCACGGAKEEPKAEEPAAPAAEEPAAPAAEADPMDELIAAAKAEGELVVYGSCEEE